MELLRGYDAWKARILDDIDHLKACPAHEDAPRRCICDCTEANHGPSGCGACRALFDEKDDQCDEFRPMKPVCESYQILA